MKNFQFERDYLQETAKAPFWQWILLGVMMLVALIPVFTIVHRDSLMILVGASLVIVGGFWVIQWQTLRTAMQAARHEWRESAPDELLGVVSGWQLATGKVLAVLAHRWYWHVLSAFVLGALALMISGYLGRIAITLYTFPASDGSTIVEQIDPNAVYSRYLLRDYFTYTAMLPIELMSPFPNPVGLVLGGVVLLGMNFVSAFLSATLGLLWGRHEPRQAVAVRGLIVFVGLVIWLGLFWVRGTWLADLELVVWRDTCETSIELIPDSLLDCQQIEQDTFILRIVESVEAIGASLIEGGVLSTSLLMPTSWTLGGYFADGYYFFPFMGRHLMILGCSAGIQLALGWFFLRLSANQFSAKKSE